VMVTRQELEKFDPEGTRSVDIVDFVEGEEIDPVYYETTYHLAPDRGAGRSYALLAEAMRREGKVGIARVVLRTKQYVCAVRPLGKGLAMSTLLYADEIVPVSRISGLEDLPKPDPRELEMAKKLVESLSAKWDPRKYKDTYREKVLDLLEKKGRGETIEAPPAERPAKVVNLADALAASLARGRRGGDRGEYRHRPRAAARGARRRKT